jgi:hypothetical protein
LAGRGCQLVPLLRTTAAVQQRKQTHCSRLDLGSVRTLWLASAARGWLCVLVSHYGVSLGQLQARWMHIHRRNSCCDPFVFVACTVILCCFCSQILPLEVGAMVHWLLLSVGTLMLWQRQCSFFELVTYRNQPHGHGVCTHKTCWPCKDIHFLQVLPGCYRQLSSTGSLEPCCGCSCTKQECRVTYGAGARSKFRSMHFVRCGSCTAPG